MALATGPRKTDLLIPAFVSRKSTVVDCVSEAAFDRNPKKIRRRVG